MAARVRTIEHGIVLQDFSKIDDLATALATVAEARTFMKSRAQDHTTLVLSDFSEMFFNQSVTDAIRKLAGDHEPYVRASAVVGLTSIMRIILRAVVALTGRDIRMFERREEAIAWLAGFAGHAPEASASPSKREAGPR
jgi:hypothetical protein